MKEAVFWLLDFAGYRPGMMPQDICVVKPDIAEKREFILPKKNENNDKIIRYLCEERGLSPQTVQSFIQLGIMYESSPYHNVVFLGNDKNGVTRFASMRGIYDKDGKAFKCDVTGNDKNYGFCMIVPDSDVVNVFEAPIDMMSYVQIYDAWNENAIALGGVADHPLETILQDYPYIRTIRLCLDNDEAGIKSANELSKKYVSKGYEVLVVVPQNECKDFNDVLRARALKEGLQKSSR